MPRPDLSYLDPIQLFGNQRTFIFCTDILPKLSHAEAPGVIARQKDSKSDAEPLMLDPGKGHAQFEAVLDECVSRMVLNFSPNIR